MPPLTIGLTGGVASGKSLAAAAFAARGAPVLDADQVARDIVVPGSPALADIVRAFGAESLQPDGQLDRRRMRERVFRDADERRRLERITHPRIRERLVAWRDAQAAPYCILAVAILVESGMDALVDRILVIDTTPDRQLAWLTARDGIDPGLARGMLAAQASREQRLARATDVIANAGTPADLDQAVGRLHEAYLDMARSGSRAAPGLRLP